MSSFGLRSRRVALASLAIFALAGGIAYAAIPDAGTGAFHACMLKGSGMIRIIDPETQQCNTAHETPITLGAKGDQGIQGIQGVRGPAGADGANGVSPRVAQLTPGDANCPAGGAAITDAAGSTAYVCSGTNGQSFSGTFTSPNHQFSLSVTDSGVEISGPDATVSLPSGGGVTVMSSGSVLVKGDRVETVANNEAITVHGDRTETVDNNENIRVGGNRTETVDSNENIRVGGNRTETVGGDETLTVQGNRTETVSGSLGLRASGALNLGGSFVGVNGGTACRPVARVGDAIDPIADLISTGSPTVCIGG